MKEAMFYEKIGGDIVQCSLCPHNCRISPDRVGICRVRKNINGSLYTTNYGRISSWAMDPIEKKPLYHFYPGSRIFSIGSLGCNFRCKFCQNWQIAQLADIPIELMPPRELVDIAKTQKGNIGIAYTYNEPTIWYEYVLECAKMAKEAGLKNVLITNGFIEKEPLEEILPYIDAMNIDVKAFREDFYKEMTSGRLAPVKQTVEKAQKRCLVEVTTLIIPGMNDKTEDIVALAKWLSHLRKDIPLHLTRYFPNYKLDIPPTPVETVKQARNIALEYLDFVYTGNIASGNGNNTYCPECGSIAIRRFGSLIEKKTEDKRCINCKRTISLVDG